jgi:4-carboxymuconolactone decarboxylase
MARIPYLDPESASEEVRKTFDQLPVQLNVFRMVANAESCFRPFIGLGTSILGAQQLDARLRELVILYVAALWNGRYERNQHVPIAKAVGATDDQIRAIDDGRIDDACFSAADKAILKFTGEVVEHGKASDPTFAAASEHLSPREIVELVLAIGFYTTVAMLCETTDVDIDPPADTKVVDAARSRG